MALIAGEKGLALGHVTINEVVSKIRGCLKSVLLRQPPFILMGSDISSGAPSKLHTAVLP